MLGGSCTKPKLRAHSNLYLRTTRRPRSSLQAAQLRQPLPISKGSGKVQVGLCFGALAPEVCHLPAAHALAGIVQVPQIHQP